ncbi:hypothetical protein [Cellulophaga fucicola]|uniref:Tetratricopeptide repeat-containing protein n=1 Tax=Cellulophaga fucicola TaxID=76595 RepID=A0A1K1QUQ4_9FLAO|nr:hypothetical protein [Cellulophaga fucicola]SFW63363.1 hypothetical protein SAMN05660313_02959 [Cellulophaga fucicola]
MKKKLYFIAIAFISVMGVSYAQETAAATVDKSECANNFQLYAQDAKVKNYDAAYGPWKKVYEACPDYHYANYAYGERILKHKIDKATGAEKTEFVNMLLGVYDNYLKYFPTKTSKAEILIDKQLLKYDEKMSTDAEDYAALHIAFTEDKEHFKNAKALYLYFSSLVDLHKAGKEELQTVFDVYDDVTEKIEEENKELVATITKLLPKEDAGTLTKKEKQLLRVSSANSENYGKIASSVDSKLGDLANCENLIPLYEKNFEEKQNDLTWVKRAVSRMYSKECLDSPMFKKLFEKQLAMEPSANAYLYSASLKLKSGDSKGALADFTKASELETDPYKKANILYKIANSYSRISKSTSYRYAGKSLEANPSNGRAYLLMARLVSSSANDCGSTRFEKLAVNWKAAELARKAGRVDPSLKSASASAASSYSQRAPTKTDIFSNNMQGKTVTFNCWVGGSVKVPNL